MRIRIIAVGERMPRWVDEVVDDYTRRLAGGLKVALVEVPAGQRSGRGDPAQAIHSEGQRILALIKPQEFVAALDERGVQMATRELATWLSGRMNDGRDLVLVIGGPDGLAPAVLTRSDQQLALSRLTLPHPLVRVVLAEQLYRAHHPFLVDIRIIATETAVSEVRCP